MFIIDLDWKWESCWLTWQKGNVKKSSVKHRKDSRKNSTPFFIASLLFVSCFIEWFNICIARAQPHCLWTGPHLMVFGGGGAQDLWCTHKSMLAFDKEAVSRRNCWQMARYWPEATGNVALCLNTPLHWLTLVISISLLCVAHYIRTWTFLRHLDICFQADDGRNTSEICYYIYALLLVI